MNEPPIGHILGVLAKLDVTEVAPGAGTPRRSTAAISRAGPRADRRVTISCQVSEIEIVWQLAEAGTGISINVNVSLPEREAHRLDGQQNVISESLRRLTALAEHSS